MPIHIVDLLGCTKDLRVCPSSTIAEVKSRIQEKEGVPPGLQLTFADNILENGRTLRDCGLQPDCTLHSSLQLRGRKPVILLYTPAEMEVSVRLTLGPEWNFSALYPEPSWKGRLPPPVSTRPIALVPPPPPYSRGKGAGGGGSLRPFQYP